MSLTDTGAASVRLRWLYVFCSIAAFLIAVLFPVGDGVVALSLRSAVGRGWILLWMSIQSGALMAPGLLIGLLLAKRFARIAWWLGSGWMFIALLMLLGDLLAHGWIAERLLSNVVWSALQELPRGLAGHIAASTWILFASTFIGWVVFVALATWPWKSPLPSFRSIKIVDVASIATVTIAAVGVFFPRLQSESARYPLNVFAFAQPRNSQQNANQPVHTPDQIGAASEMDAKLDALDRQWQQARIQRVGESRRDVVIVIVESLRSELVARDVMPSLWGFAEKGVHCQRHFSSSNATSHGMFSLMNGVDAVWYGRRCRDASLMNRLFRQAGYEIGFFAGHDDWNQFQMAGFINARHYDRFEVEPMNWLTSDRRAAQAAAAFLNEDRIERPPRLAILYLYSTHANYRSYTNDQIFQPAAGDRFLIPFDKQSVPLVWNRYKNAAHTADRFMSMVLRQDRVCVVTGDHGESFLEDGVCGHGTRISKFQNMTPAVVFFPGVEHRNIQRPTSHVDVLPTILSAAGIETNAEVCEGIDLVSVDADDLNQRIVLTRNYLTNGCGLIRHSASPQAPFAYRYDISFEEWNVMQIDAINELGNPVNDFDEDDSRSVLFEWQQDRFGKADASF